MTERVIAILNALGIGDWRVTETSSETAELYFVKKNSRRIHRFMMAQ